MSPTDSLPAAVRDHIDWSALEQRLSMQATADRTLYAGTVTSIREGLASAFQQGCDIADLVHARAWIMDRLLMRLWKTFGLDQEPSLGLAAVGGYGRGELHPGSDVDILVLFDPALTDRTQEQIGLFLTFLWDIGLEPGHSVRSLDECVAQAAGDITVATNLLECRPLTGDPRLFGNLQERIGPGHMWNSREFFAAKLEEQQQRHGRFGETAYRLEPNLKESPGGLRDIQMISWVAKRHFGAGDLQELVSHGFLTQMEYQELMAGQAHLWRIRFALHCLSGRKEDRLLFDYQRRLASLLGFCDEDHNLAVEQFMQEYFRTVIRLERLNEMLLQHFREAILLENTQDDVVPINRRFQARCGFLEVTHPDVFTRYPPAMMEVFLILQQHPDLKGIRASTIRLIRAHLHLINDAFRNNLGCRSLFMEILRQPQGVTRQLRRMNRYGVLAAYLPAFGMIVGRMQYDLFHVYTVDEHTLTVIRNLRRMAIAEHAHEMPECSRIFRYIPKPELLYLAALFHDIAKGRGGDHSELGAVEARQFCLQHGLSNYDASLVAWLVKTHLLMSLTAQRRDISDPEVALDFAQEMGNLNRLNHLYLLTVADIRGTNPKLWNSWRSALLSGLYNATQRMLQRGLDNLPGQEELVGEVQTQALTMLKASGLDERSCMGIWSGLEEDYFLRHSADEIAWHTLLIQSSHEADLPVVQIRRETARGGTEIFLYTHDHPHLFALTTTALTQLGLDIVDARIITSDSGFSLNSFLVLEDSGRPVADDFRAQEIVRFLRERLADTSKEPCAVTRAIPRQLKHFNVPTDVSFAPQTHNNRTILLISTGDRPGLLSQISLVLTACRLRVHNARISTAGETAEDLFYITHYDGRPVLESEQQAFIRQKILAALGTGATGMAASG